MAGQLPEGWTEDVDPKGRPFYSNHKTMSTTWDRPSAPVDDSGPPSYRRTAATRQASYGHPNGQQGPPITCACTPRLTFWIASALVWVVWAFAVSAGADDHWLEDEDFAAGDDTILEYCDDNDNSGIENETADEFCDLYRAFTAMQFVATIMISIGLVILGMALFRPAVAGCCSTKALGIGGGVMVAAYAFFQLLAFVLVVAIEKTEDDLGEFFGGQDIKLGPTFGVAVVGFILAMFVAGVLMAFARGAGDGLFYSCVRDCMQMNSPHASGGGPAPPAPSGGVVHSQPPPAAPAAPAQPQTTAPQATTPAAAS